MNIDIVICPVCLMKYNAEFTPTDNIYGVEYIQCPHCKNWNKPEDIKESQSKLKELLK